MAFVDDEPMNEIIAGRKRFVIRASFRGLACASVREGDVLFLKRVGAEVEAACNVGQALFYRDVRHDEVTPLARGFVDAISQSYLRRYAPPRNLQRSVNVAVIELLDVRKASR